MSPCKFAHTLSELTVCRAPPNMNCRTISTVMTVRLSVAEVCRSLYCDSPEHCAWLASTSAHKQLLVARPGAVGWYFFICSILVLQWDPATCAAILFCAGNALPVNTYFRCGGVCSAHSRQILPTCAQFFPLHCPVHTLQWACVTTIRA